MKLGAAQGPLDPRGALDLRGLPRAVPDRPVARRRRRHDLGHRRAPARPTCPTSSATARATPTPTTARRSRRSRLSCRSCWRASTRRPRGGRRRPPRPPWPASRARSTSGSPTTGPPSAPSTSPSMTSLGKRLGLPVHRLLGLPAEIPPTDFTIGIDEPEVVAARAGPGQPLPGAQDQGRRAGRPRDARGRAARVRRADPGRRQHGLGARRRGAPAAGPRPPRRGAHRAALPGAIGSTSSAGSRSARRCPSSPTRAR